MTRRGSPAASTSSYVRSSVSISSSRPTKARCRPETPAWPHERERTQAGAGTRRRRVCLSPRSSCGSSNSNAPRTAATVRSPTRISPGSAACSSRAATLTGSPETNELPTRGLPTTTSPVLTPIRSASDIAEELAQATLHRERRVQRSLGVILERRRARRTPPSPRRRRTSRRSARGLDLLGHRVVEALEEQRASAPDPAIRRAPSSPRGLRRPPSRACARSAPERLDRSRAHGAEAGGCREDGTAGGTDVHGTEA